MSLLTRRLPLNHHIIRRNLGLTSIVYQKTDPIQQLFVDKIREYYQKRSKTSDGLVDATAEVRKSLEDTLAKLKNAYGAETEDLLTLPKYTFKDPQLDSIVDKTKKSMTQRPVVLKSGDLEKYSQAYEAWSIRAKEGKQEVERERKLHDEKSKTSLPG
ncbi:unnamed protein product [Didymodactylos carnosus]|uniref:ATP synthase-coupling factor 6, mitochondrial n=1 Tax=Didymodactylos carnosus TaxID=1234261 RepID=A0A814QQX7_9BILA|nr:unnamed protein product [Didymodactylos carnosus]CAF1123096.1 unnamed protein product [Didymodactylos carnosus]CAF3707747.1 unnamed protein product [Didymodactylos carnosus]CAF3886591.1 unnamed protein product [Didymodactylos carnosus]